MGDQVISFPRALSANGIHSFVPGGIAMEVKHTHPEYKSDAERQVRLKELKKLCTMKLCAEARDDEGAA